MGNKEEIDIKKQDGKGNKHADIFQVAEEQEEENEAGKCIIFDKNVNIREVIFDDKFDARCVPVLWEFGNFGSSCIGCDI